MAQERESGFEIPIRTVHFEHYFGPFHWGKRIIGDNITIPEGLNGVEYGLVKDLFGWRVRAVIERANPNSIILWEIKSQAENESLYKRSVSDRDINLDPATKDNFLYQDN